MQAQISGGRQGHHACLARVPQVYLVCPGVLLPVLPHLQLELHDSDDSKRLQAVQLILRLVTLQDSSFAQVGAGMG
jgi:hypothetical protein